MVDPAESTIEDLVSVQAGSYREALEKIHREFGPGFRIVHTRVARREGLIGMVGGRGVEVLLVPSEDGASALEAKKREEPKPSRPKGPSSETARDLQRQIRRLLKERNEPEERSRELAEEAGRPGPPLHARILLEALEKARENKPKVEPEVERSTVVTPAHPVLRAACRLLVVIGFHPEVATEMTNELRRMPLAQWRATTSDEEAAAELEARRLLGEIIRPKMPPCAPISLPADDTQSSGPKLVALVGPTGVGKTTTIAKLSAPLSLVHNKKIGLITLDTVRLGAVDQIGRYAEIVGLEVRSVERSEDLESAVSEFRDHDVVFIDTAGASPKNGDQMEHVRSVLSRLDNVQIHLCVSASVTREVLIDVARRFRVLSYDRLLITKADEAVGAGQLVDLFQAAKVPLSYVTCGQDVPEDIATATTERIEALLFGDRK